MRSWLSFVFCTTRHSVSSKTARVTGLWSRSGCLETYQHLVSSREKLSMSRSRLGGGGQTSCLGLGHLRLEPKTNFRPNCTGHINKTSQFRSPRECFTFTAASAGVFSIYSRWVSSQVLTGKVFRIGTVRCNWPMPAYASQAFSIAHCTNSGDWYSYYCSSY